LHLPICIFQSLFWIAIFQLSTKYEDVFSLKKVIFVNLFTIMSTIVEVYAVYNTITEHKNVEEFAFPSLHSVLSNLSIYIFYMGMALRLGAFSQFQLDFARLEELSQEEQMDKKLGLELSDDELEDFQKEDKKLTRAVTITNDEDMDLILDDMEDKNFSVQQDERTHSEALKQKKNDKKKKQTKNELEHDKNLIKEMWGNMTVKESLMLN